jgi:hypothetical protein
MKQSSPFWVQETPLIGVNVTERFLAATGLRREDAAQSPGKAAARTFSKIPSRLPVRSSLWNEFGLTVFELAERAGG